MSLREQLEPLGFDLPEVQELFRCVLSAMKRGLSHEQIEWLMAKRRRCELFLEVVSG